MRNWSDVLPVVVARDQHRYERNRAAAGMKRVGMTLREIGSRLNVNPERARQLVWNFEKKWGNGQPSPIESYLQQADSK